MPTFITRDYAVSQKRTYVGGTYYVSIIGSLNGSFDAEAKVGMLQKHAGKLSNLRVFVEEGGSNGPGSVTLMRKVYPDDEWGTTELSVEIEAFYDGGVLTDPTHEVNFSAGDELCWKIVSNGTIGGLLAMRYILVRVEDQ